MRQRTNPGILFNSPHLPDVPGQALEIGKRIYASNAVGVLSSQILTFPLSAHTNICVTSDSIALQSVMDSFSFLSVFLSANGVLQMVRNFELPHKEFIRKQHF